MKRISAKDNHPGFTCFTMSSSSMRFFSKKKSLSHKDLRIAPSFFILNAANARYTS